MEVLPAPPPCERPGQQSHEPGGLQDAQQRGEARPPWAAGAAGGRQAAATSTRPPNEGPQRREGEGLDVGERDLHDHPAVAPDEGQQDEGPDGQAVAAALTGGAGEAADALESAR